MHLHIENYIIAQLQRIIYKLYVQCEENTTQIDDKYLDLFLGLRNKHCFLTRFEEEKLRMLPKRMNEKNIMKHWIFSKNELFLNRQYDFEERMKKCQEVWQGCVGEDHFYLLNEFSVLRKMNVKNNPVVNILSALLKNENKSL